MKMHRLFPLLLTIALLLTGSTLAERTITVRGTGNISLPPDQILLGLSIETENMDYDATLKAANDRLAALSAAVVGIGFDAEDLKTEDFDISTKYADSWDENGFYHYDFDGYTCRHSLSLAFDLDTDRLSEVINAISASGSDAGLSIRFTVADQSAAEEALLTAAANDAQRKAAILAEASGVQLGSLIAIDYSWSDSALFSTTSMNYAAKGAMVEEAALDFDFTPQSISQSDSATFVWEITDAQ